MRAVRLDGAAQRPPSTPRRVSVTGLLGTAWWVSRGTVVRICRVLASHPGHARGAVGPTRRVWRRRRAPGVLRRRTARDTVGHHGTEIGPVRPVECVRTWLGVAGGATEARAAAGGTRRVWRAWGGSPRGSTRSSWGSDGASHASSHGDPTGPVRTRGERGASSSFARPSTNLSGRPSTRPDLPGHLPFLGRLN
jgi:hypothetical protein